MKAKFLLGYRTPRTPAGVTLLVVAPGLAALERENSCSRKTNCSTERCDMGHMTASSTRLHDLIISLSLRFLRRPIRTREDSAYFHPHSGVNIKQ